MARIKFQSIISSTDGYERKLSLIEFRETHHFFYSKSRFRTNDGVMKEGVVKFTSENPTWSERVLCYYQ